jgi:hypothetical protein
MDWNYDRAWGRVGNLIGQRSTVLVEGIEQRRRELSEAKSAQLSAREALISIPRDRAVLVDGVHVYARLSNYDEFRLENGAETEASHKRALGFLHLLYGAMDRIVQEFGASGSTTTGPASTALSSILLAMRQLAFSRLWFLRRRFRN